MFFLVPSLRGDLELSVSQMLLNSLVGTTLQNSLSFRVLIRLSPNSSIPARGINLHYY